MLRHRDNSVSLHEKYFERFSSKIKINPKKEDDMGVAVRN